MNAITFDTLKFARTLQGQGTFTEAQSDRLVEALGDVLSSDLATKTDITDVTGRVRDLAGQVREAELRLEAKIAEAKADTIKWFFGVVGVQTLAIICSLVALLMSVRAYR